MPNTPVPPELLLNYQGTHDLAAAIFAYVEATYVRRTQHQQEISALAQRVSEIYNEVFPNSSNNNDQNNGGNE